MSRTDTETRSNAIRLAGREWAGLAAFALAVFLLGPRLWERIEPPDRDPDGRIPYELGHDYWLWGRRAREAEGIPIVGDSVVWGQYVAAAQALSSHLNRRPGGPRFANLGLDGAHPAALAGLLEHYGGGLRSRKVVLHCNPLWMTSPRADLQDPEETRINHPGLLPQFRPAIPAYRAGFSERLGTAVGRSAGFFGWARHLQSAGLGGETLPGWMLEHPYACPIAALAPRPRPPDDRLRHEPISWTARGIPRQDYPWVDLKTSIQWRSFREAVGILERRGREVFVLVGPFNEHLLAEGSLERHRAVLREIEAWLSARRIPHLVPPALPSELYADASHPLAAGYERLARQMEGLGFFR